jgi:DNA (cytosine-5)-methyltransferase 1
MTHSIYYNDIDKHACAWLQALIESKLIPAGTVDSRSVMEIEPDELAEYTQCHFFAGIGGWAYALQLAGWPEDRPVWTGSCPCQPFSAAGKQRGTDDERHLWPVFAKLIAECKPATVFGEQVASKAGREWLSGVFADLEGMGYAAAGADICAASVGAPHIRQRLWWVADTERNEQRRQEPCSGAARRVGRFVKPVPWNEPWQCALSRIRALDDGLPRSVAACDAARNAIVPQVAAEFVSAYMEAAL